MQLYELYRIRTGSEISNIVSIIIFSSSKTSSSYLIYLMHCEMASYLVDIPKHY
jgi:hypothetical protein